MVLCMCTAPVPEVCGSSSSRLLAGATAPLGQAGAVSRHLGPLLPGHALQVLHAGMLCPGALPTLLVGTCPWAHCTFLPCVSVCMRSSHYPVCVCVCVCVPSLCLPSFLALPCVFVTSGDGCVGMLCVAAAFVAAALVFTRWGGRTQW